MQNCSHFSIFQSIASCENTSLLAVPKQPTVPNCAGSVCIPKPWYSAMLTWDWGDLFKDDNKQEKLSLLGLLKWDIGFTRGLERLNCAAVWCRDPSTSPDWFNSRTRSYVFSSAWPYKPANWMTSETDYQSGCNCFFYDWACISAGFCAIKMFRQEDAVEVVSAPCSNWVHSYIS